MSGSHRKLAPQEAHQLLHPTMRVVLVDLGDRGRLQSSTEVLAQLTEQLGRRDQRQLREGVAGVAAFQHVRQRVGEASLLRLLRIDLAVAMQRALVLRGFWTRAGGLVGTPAAIAFDGLVKGPFAVLLGKGKDAGRASIRHHDPGRRYVLHKWAPQSRSRGVERRPTPGADGGRWALSGSER